MDYDVWQLRCLTTVSTAVWQIARPQCVWQCLQKKTCRYINYNSDTGQCELGLGPCESLQPAAGVMVNALGAARHDCLHWGSRKKPGWISVQARNGAISVARRVSGNVVLIGKINNLDNKFRANSEGTVVVTGPIQVTDEDIEILMVDAACPFPWMTYTAGEPLPAGAIAGGHLADRTTTYVVRITLNGKANFGYYESKSALAYYAHRGSACSSTSMEILVLI